MPPRARPNCIVRDVLRPGQRTILGSDQVVSVFRDRRARLERRSLQVVDADGRSHEVDATLDIRGVVLHTSDRVVIEEHARTFRYVVRAADPIYDVHGRAVGTVAQLTRESEERAAR